MLSLSREKFHQLAQQGNLIPIYREIMGDVETPLSAYLKIDTGDHSFLFESVEKGGRFARYSFLGANPSVIFRAKKGEVEIIEKGKSRRFASAKDPLDDLEKWMEAYQPVGHEDLPLFYGGAVGYVAYEAATYFEPTVPRAACDDLEVPDLYFVISDTLLIFDHHERKIKILANAHVQQKDEVSIQKAYDQAEKKIQALTERLKQPISSKIFDLLHLPTALEPTAQITQERYLHMVEAMQESIRAGDIFQAVASQRFEVPFKESPVDLYRALRLINPSPYMFCLKFGDLALVGASPEVHVRCEKGQVEIRPIAGTRPRQEDPQADAAMAEELLADPKERAEHVMLVDLARNDIGRVCSFQTVEVTDFMTIERYSHVMHLVSHVRGKLHGHQSAYDVMRATLPAGTLSGAPKVRAMQIIAEQETTVRGPYGGAVGYFGFSGNLDSCIAIRTVLLQNGKAYLQAGGGVVADSTPMGEYQESQNKAKAGLQGLALATQLGAL